MTAQPRLTLDYAAMAGRIVQQLALEPGERVLSVAHPGTFADLMPTSATKSCAPAESTSVWCEVLHEPVPGTFDPAVLQKGTRDARSHYKAMFRDVDAAIMMPGANTTHPAYLAMQDWLKDDLKERRGRRTVHFHWVEGASAYAVRRLSRLPPRFAIDAVYQRALLETDYPRLARGAASSLRRR